MMTSAAKREARIWGYLFNLGRSQRGLWLTWLGWPKHQRVWNDPHGRRVKR